MQGRAGVVVLLVALFAAGLAAGAIRAADPAPPPGTTNESTIETSTSEATTTIPADPTTLTTTTAPATTETRATVRTVLPVSRPIEGGCLLVGAFAVREPGQETRVLGPMAEVPRMDAVAARAVGYPADGAVVTAASLDLGTSGCRNGTAEVRSVSLFHGEITADVVALSVRGNQVASRISGLAVHGRRVAADPGRHLPIGRWGYAVALEPAQGALSSAAGALAVHLVARHAGLPAGTVVHVSFAVPPPEPAAPKRAAKPVAQSDKGRHARRTARPKVRRHARVRKPHRRHARARLRGAPLNVTPALGVTHYVFPVAGESSYVDTYGAFRGDVPGNWHHGDDIFAAVGAPVIAVADGTLNRVGWQRLGGWRLWVRDGMRNEFYYAHLSGYSPLALHSKHVKAGDVIGFVGNTGDAFTTSPHVHFEIHPHQLLHLDYNGAVNPTGYLDSWPHLAHPRAPKPVHPPFPSGAVRAEARFVWRQLLAARGLIAHAPKPSERPRIHVPRPDSAFEVRRIAASAGPRARGHASDTVLLDVLAGLVAPSAAFGLTLVLRLRRKPS